MAKCYSLDRNEVGPRKGTEKGKLYASVNGIWYRKSRYNILCELCGG